MSGALRVAVTVEQCWHRVPGGTAWSVLELLGALDRRADVEVVGVAARHLHPPPAPWVPPVAVRHLPLPRRLLYETWHGLGRLSVELATGPVDVVHATAVAVPPSSAPLVVTVHDLAFLADPSQATRHGNRFFRRGMHLARARARLVLCPSVATREECVAAGFEPGRLRVVPWGVTSTSATPPAVADVRRRHDLRLPYLMFTGTVEPRKNLPRLLAAFAALGRDDIELVLVGPDGWNEDLAARLSGLGPARTRVRPLGFVPRDDLAPLYAGAEMFCYPSLREGFGLPVLEAMAQGTAVVTSRGTATEEVGGDAALLVDPLDTAALAAALTKVLDDDCLRRDLGRRGRERAAGYTWERTAELTVDAYREAAT